MSTEGTRRSGVEVRFDGESLGRGVVFGIVSFLVGYLLSFAITASRLNEGFAEVFPAWKVVGWYYYNAHFVDLAGSFSAGPFGGTGAGSLIAAADGGAVTLLYLVPPLALLIGGWLMARQFGPPSDPAEGAKAGALVVVGYFPLALIGAFATGHTATAQVPIVEVSTTVRPQVLPAVLLAGVLYPIVFGVTGGAAAAALAGE